MNVNTISIFMLTLIITSKIRVQLFYILHLLLRSQRPPQPSMLERANMTPEVTRSNPVTGNPF